MTRSMFKSSKATRQGTRNSARGQCGAACKYRRSAKEGPSAASRSVLQLPLVTLLAGRPNPASVRMSTRPAKSGGRTWIMRSKVKVGCRSWRFSATRHAVGGWQPADGHTPNHLFRPAVWSLPQLPHTPVTKSLLKQLLARCACTRDAVQLTICSAGGVAAPPRLTS
jgi:hypothetical protein